MKMYIDKEALEYELDNYQTIGRSEVYLTDVAENLINYALAHMNNSKDEMAEFLAEAFGCEIGEIAMFINDDLLTDYTKSEKYETIEDLTVPHAA